MKPIKKKLALSRETLRSLSHTDLAAANGGIIVNPSGLSCRGTCAASACQTVCHSLFDSCFNTDCCLEKP